MAKQSVQTIDYVRGTWVYGAFFEIRWDYCDENRDLLRELRKSKAEYVIQDLPEGDDCLSIEDVGSDGIESVYGCPAFSSHVTTGSRRARFDAYGGRMRTIRPFVPIVFPSNSWTITNILYHDLLAQGFEGIQVYRALDDWRQAKSTEEVAIQARDIQLYHCDITQGSWELRKRLPDGSVPRCPDCRAELICSGCGLINESCPVCNRFSARRIYDHESKGYIYEFDPLNEVSGFMGSYWKGTDFFAVYISRRVLAYLLSKNVCPFIAVSVPVDTSGMKDDSKKELLKIRDIALPRRGSGGTL